MVAERWMVTLGVCLVVLEPPPFWLDSSSRGTRSDSDWPRHHQLGWPAEISVVEKTWVGKCEKLWAGSQGSKIAGRDSSRSEILDLGCEGGCVGGSCRKLPAHIVVAHGGCAYLGGSPARIGTGQSKRPCKLGKRLRGRLQSELIPKIRGGPASESSSNNPPPCSSSFSSGHCYYTTAHTTAAITTALQHVGTIYCAQ